MLAQTRHKGGICVAAIVCGVLNFVAHT